MMIKRGFHRALTVFELQSTLKAISRGVLTDNVTMVTYYAMAKTFSSMIGHSNDTNIVTLTS